MAAQSWYNLFGFLFVCLFLPSGVFYLVYLPLYPDRSDPLLCELMAHPCEFKSDNMEEFSN